MNAIEQYEFDRLGYLIIKDMLGREDVRALAKATDELEEHAARHVTLSPRKHFPWGGGDAHRSERGYHVHGLRGAGQTLIVEDFWNFSPAYDRLLNHPKTMDYIHALVVGRPTINNSEVRIRYSGNASGTHMGGPIDHKYRYAFTGGRIDCMMTRMIYFLHDVSSEQGAFCVVPASHKSNFKSPYTQNQDHEPGMIGLEVNAGDAILFTENLRHGGFTNRSAQTRKTLHVGYGPHWMMSQNISTMDEPQYLTEETRERLSPERLALFHAWAPVPAEAIA
jgi:ectoine hydroxylase-related dioxygenase (phytanoyl-CoA dioxygenase family)